ncbi:helix-turn-helix domain-containing protein [Rubinisphaera sp.]|uniref:helix-turn-helix domain-containing protein n=1 Tax=Rubinisphaera sp. TaxID=2024857 RepID=UPI0025FC1A6E|nr:helix-turn-helix domain-containing protein [Rubinisphaera sp.]
MISVSTTEQSRLLNTRQAAAYLGLCERKIWQMSKDGDFPSVRAGKSLRFDVQDLDSWIENQKTVTVADNE